MKNCLYFSIQILVLIILLLGTDFLLNQFSVNKIEKMYKCCLIWNSLKSASKLSLGDSLFLLFTLRRTLVTSSVATNLARPRIRLVDASLDWNLNVMKSLRQPLHLKYVKLIHAVKVAQLHFVVKMASVVMKILFTMQLPIISMNANVFVLITTQVRSNIGYII